MLKKFIKFLKNKILIRRITKDKNIKNIFSAIYKINYWGDNESVSGPGSNNKNTKQLIKKLKFVINKYKIKKIVDAPCGDFNWIKKLILGSNINYIGIDIVKELIKKNQKTYESNKIKFYNLNLITKKIPECDLIICRDFVFHLSNKDVLLFFKNLLKTNFKYILISNHTKNGKFFNRNIKSGDFRKIDLFSQPFNFIEDYEMVVKDFCDGKEKYLLLFKSSKIKKFIKTNN